MPSGLDLTTQALTISLHDDDEIYGATIPAGTLREVGPGRFVWNDAAGSISGIRSVSFVRRRHQAVFGLRTVLLDLRAADRTDHFVELSLRAGTLLITTTPLWQFDGHRLATRS